MVFVEHWRASKALLLPLTPSPAPDTGIDMPSGDFSVTHHPASFEAAGCEAMCSGNPKCKAWTWVIRGEPAGSGDCCLKGSLECPKPFGACTSGAKINTTVPNCGANKGSSLSCTIEYTPPTDTSKPFYEVPVQCGGHTDTLRLTPGEKTVELRVYSDWTITEAYFQQGRVAMTISQATADDATVTLESSSAVTVASTAVYPIRAIWTTEDAVRAAPRVFK